MKRAADLSDQELDAEIARCDYRSAMLSGQAATDWFAQATILRQVRRARRAAAKQGPTPEDAEKDT